LVLVAAVAASPVLARGAATQPGDASTDPQAPLEEVVVTATKRSESLQAVPISVSAIDGDALAAARITSPDGLVTRVANLQLTAIVGENTPVFSLRGVSMFDYSLNQSSPVATYYDEVYKGNFALLGVAMYDLERVEVLQGRKARSTARTRPVVRSTSSAARRNWARRAGT
jgi:iron complex outermembrane receptor protein